MNKKLRLVAMLVSLAALVFIIYKSVTVFVGITAFENYLQWTGIATLVWFLIAPIWLWKR